METSSISKRSIIMNSTPCIIDGNLDSCNLTDMNDNNNENLSFIAELMDDQLNTTNSTEIFIEVSPRFLRQIILCITLGTIILLTIAGNTLVIVSIVKEKSLQCVGNSLVVSLAVADLLVACLVMPFAVISEVAEKWPYGTVLCDLWTCFDVLCCTASILHLLAIALHRYWSVTKLDYIRKRNGFRTGCMISAAWAIACTVSLPPAIGWKDPDFGRRVLEDKRCLVSQDVGYQVFATFSTFYGPLSLTLFLYWRIYKVAKQRIRNRPGNRVVLGTQKVSAQNLAPPALEMSPKSELSVSVQDSDNSTVNGSTAGNSNTTTPIHQKKRRKKTKRSSIEAKREKKAAKILAIITGVFVVCWLPFFLMALIMPFCPNLEISNLAASILLWLGYINSMINPIIYTIFSPDFRSAFRKLLCFERDPARDRNNPRIVLQGSKV